MKMSVVLGVIHMTFALCLQVPNHLNFKRKMDIYTNFIPQIIFLESIFGYLVVCVIYKWAIDWSESATDPPSLLNMLIEMFLSPGHVDPKNQLYRGQSTVQVILLLLAAICVPWLLFTKPYLVWKEMNKTQAQGYVTLGHESATSDHQRISLEDEEEGNGHPMIQEGETDGEHHDFSDVVVHQVIHTIEFCLGCISHTASYLRLWALSLAHAQLSEVLWSMTLGNFLPPKGVGGWIGLVIMAAMWLTWTIGILCMMEGLSAFLHALRLHWVEGNSKHFEGGGHAFNPLTFANPDGKE